jgi:alpha-tubulin suppressor-like RCC1 family protein
VSSIAVGRCHALALAEDGLMYAWGHTTCRGGFLGIPDVQRELTPKPVEALLGVRVGNIAAGSNRSYAVADTGELWAWGCDGVPLGHGDWCDCPAPKLIASLRGVKVDAATASDRHVLALADDGRVYAWGGDLAARVGSLGLGAAVSTEGERSESVLSPQRVPGLRMACGLLR